MNGATSYLEFLFPLIGVFVGVAVPVLLGLFLYHRQKAVDVKMQLYGEKRLAYRDFISSLVVLNDSLTHIFIETEEGEEEVELNYSEEAMNDAQLKLAVVRLYSNDNIFELGKSLIVKMQNLASSNGQAEEEEFLTIFDLSAAMRADLEKGLKQ